MSMQDVKVIEELERRKEFDDALEQVVNEMRDDEWLTLDEIAARCGKKMRENRRRRRQEGYERLMRALRESKEKK